MLSEENMCKANQVQNNKHFKNEVIQTSTPIVINKRNTTDTSTKNKVFTPYQKDKLFWCFYKIINESWDENENFRIEKEFKIDVTNEIKKL